jgi:signal transduction histidine kinase
MELPAGTAYGGAMGSAAVRSHAPGLGPGRAGWPEHGWRDTRFVAAGVPVQLAALVIIAAPWTGLGGLVPYPSTPTQILLAIGVPAAVLLTALPALTAAQRHRLRELLGVDIPPPRARGRWWTWRGVAAAARSGSTWRELGYHLLVAPLLAVGGLLAVGLWAAAAALAGIFAYAWAFPAASLMRASGYITWDAALTVLGVALLLVAPRAAGIVTRIDVRAASALLGPSDLQRRVQVLTESRAGVLDAADAERRRIERDLHDGAQQRLVSLIMNLGLARASMPDLPDAARRVIAEAHEEAKEALAELRTLARGLHPAILEDRGLDAALSGIAARAPLPVRLCVDVPVRASPTVEAVAYFVVSEALANVAKHAGASRAEIEVRHERGMLSVIITDDGAGGADPSRGSGLLGLAQRVRSVDGTLTVSSPAGGPTIITAELPCAS